MVAAGYDNGDVKLFDLRTNTMRWETNIGNGVRLLLWTTKFRDAWVFCHAAVPWVLGRLTASSSQTLFVPLLQTLVV